MKKVYLITGATGIGAATARLAATSGAKVFVASRAEADCQTLSAEIIAKGGECAFYAADLRIASEVREAVGECTRRYGQIDRLFNVVGISGRRFGDGPVHECTEDGWDITLDTNLKSMFLMCREVINRMLAQPVGPDNLRGSILNMASVLAFHPEARFFATHAYAASKAAIIGLSRSMAAYYAEHKIRVNVIAPALVCTPMSQRAQSDPEIIELMRTKQPLTKDFIEADDVARAALFLLSDDARAITGDVLTVDAGWCVS